LFCGLRIEPGWLAPGFADPARVFSHAHRVDFRRGRLRRIELLEPRRDREHAKRSVQFDDLRCREKRHGSVAAHVVSDRRSSLDDFTQRRGAAFRDTVHEPMNGAPGLVQVKRLVSRGVRKSKGGERARHLLRTLRHLGHQRLGLREEGRRELFVKELLEVGAASAHFLKRAAKKLLRRAG